MYALKLAMNFDEEIGRVYAVGGGSSSAPKETEEQKAQNAEIARLQEENQTQMDTMMYNSGRNSRIMWAQGVGMEKVNSEMTEAMTNAQKTISGYETQERRRLFEAKKGSGQVDASDTAITQDMYKAAKKTITDGSSAWDEKRSAAMNVGGGGWDGQHGSLEDWLAKKKAGRTTTASTTSTATGGQTNTSNNTLGSSTFGDQNDKRWNDTGL